MSKISDLTTKSNPIGTDLVTGLDSEDTNPQTKNKNFTIDSISNKTFEAKTTDNLTEGTVNLYYSDALVSANSTVVGKADKTNVLEKDNTTPYTPTLPYHPVTKDYADNMTIPDATNTIKGKIRIATDIEASAGVDELTSVNPKQLKDNLPVFPGTTTTYFTQGTDFINNQTKTYTFNVTKNGTYRVAISFSQSSSGGGGNMYITTDNIRIPVWSTNTVGSKTLGDDVLFSSGASSNETYFIEGIAGTSIQVVGSAGSQSLTVNSILITGS